MFEFGKEQAEKYGDQIVVALAYKTISKRKDLAEEPGGLIYEANRLGIDKWNLLEALEGMCRDGRAVEIDDSTYTVRRHPRDRINNEEEKDLSSVWCRDKATGKTICADCGKGVRYNNWGRPVFSPFCPQCGIKIKHIPELL